MTGLRVAVLAGGPSSEAAVSRISAAAVRSALVEAGHVPEVIELDADLAGSLRSGSFDVVFPVTHGPVGEDGCVQGLLEVLGLRYVGSGVLASALAASKPHAKAMFRMQGLPVAEELLVYRGDDLEQRVGEIRARLGEAVVAKPAGGGSAIGIGRVEVGAPAGALREALELALEVDSCVLVERLVRGEEITCGVLEDDQQGPVSLPPTLIVSKAAGWYDFSSKYAPGGSEHRCPAGLSSAVTARIGELAVAAHQCLGARDLSRVDMILGQKADPGSLVLLEVNTLPGFTGTSLYPEAAAAMGLSFPVLCDRLARRALARPLRVSPDVMPMP